MRRKEIDGIKIVRAAPRGQRKLKRAQRTETGLHLNVVKGV